MCDVLGALSVKKSNAPSGLWQFIVYLFDDHRRGRLVSRKKKNGWRVLRPVLSCRCTTKTPRTTEKYKRSRLHQSNWMLEKRKPALRLSSSVKKNVFLRYWLRGSECKNSNNRWHFHHIGLFLSIKLFSTTLSCCLTCIALKMSPCLCFWLVVALIVCLQRQYGPLVGGLILRFHFQTPFSTF